VGVDAMGGGGRGKGRGKRGAGQSQPGPMPQGAAGWSPPLGPGANAYGDATLVMPMMPTEPMAPMVSMPYMAAPQQYPGMPLAAAGAPWPGAWGGALTPATYAGHPVAYGQVMGAQAPVPAAASNDQRHNRRDRRRERRGGGGGRGRGGGEKGRGKKGGGGGFVEEPDSEDEDQRHFAEVCYSLVGYLDDVSSDLRWIEEAFQGVTDPHDRVLLKPGSEHMLGEMRARISANARFLSMLVESDEDARQFARIPRSHHVQERNAVKVRTVLRQFVRDWAEEGAQERELQYGVLLRALERYLPLPGKSRGRPLRVLTPGSGLSRLPFEVARRGYSAQGNEFSYHMLQGSKWVLNETSEPKTHLIFPFVLSLEHRKDSMDHLRGVLVPDVCPSLELGPSGPDSRPQDFSMCAGEFVEVYADQEKQWDAVLTCFFLDTAKNVFLYIRTIAYIVRPGGIWANIGPLLYHYAEQPNAVSVELSWEEVKPFICQYFDFKEEEMREAYYTTNEKSLFHTKYRCKYFVAVRNDRPVTGRSHPVF